MLACAGLEVPPIVAVARDLRVAADTVRKWRRRFLVDRLDGLVDEPRPGRPPTIGVDRVEAVVVTTLEKIPRNVRVSLRGGESGTTSRPTNARTVSRFHPKPAHTRAPRRRTGPVALSYDLGHASGTRERRPDSRRAWQSTRESGCGPAAHVP
ncbi:helix-turn-helix domain-containing protein [Streptomyces sp. SID3343]|uniref:helix-turn-helix domain-containing protein n=1 Tax=Streptomyces sp. SID3343 TaxID=2690260 RepID=UPI0031F75E9F